MAVSPTVSWAWIFPDAPYEYGKPGYFEPAVGNMVNPRHPSQLYEAGLEGLLLGVYMLWRFWGKGGRSRAPGQLTAEFLVLYALVRIFGEQFRQPDIGVTQYFGVSRGVLLSIATLAVGVGLWVWTRRRDETKGPDHTK